MDIMPFVSAFGGNPYVPQSEDCEFELPTAIRAPLTCNFLAGLSLNVIAPAEARPGARLPVVVVGPSDRAS